MGFSLLPNAEVIPCEVFAENLNSEVILGNLNYQGVEEIWASPKARKFRNMATISNKACNVCPNLNICGSYCIAEIYLKYGELTPPEEYYKECRKAWTFNTEHLENSRLHNS